MDKLATNKKIIAMSEKISKAIELEAEEILADAESVVKQYIPARKVKAVLLKLEKALETEGMEVVFDKKVTREAIRRTASEEVTAKELNEFINAITAAVVAEMEDVLEDADEVAGETVAACGNTFEVESKLKSTLEKKMASKGIYCTLERKASKTASNRIFDKIKNVK